MKSHEKIAAAFMDRRKLNKAAYEAALTEWFGIVFLTAGAEELKENFDFNEQAVGVWAEGMLIRARGLLIKEEVTENDAV